MSSKEREAAISNFFGEGYHATGGWLLHVIQEVKGKRGVLKVMADPRKLPVVYNECAAKRNGPFRFDPQVVKATEKLGGILRAYAKSLTGK